MDVKRKAWKESGKKRARQGLPSPKDIRPKIKIWPWKTPILPYREEITLEKLLARKRKNYFYIMHLSYDGEMKEELWDYARKNRLIGLSHGEVTDWSRERKSIISGRELSQMWVNQFDWFCFDIKKEDIVLVLDGQDYLLGVAKVREDRHQLHKDNKFFDHVRRVQWIEKHKYAQRRRLPQRVPFSNTLLKVTPEMKRWSILEKLPIYPKQL